MADQRKPPLRFGVAAYAAFLLLLLYALGSGPLLGLATRGYVQPWVFEITYGPLHKLAIRIPTFGNVLSQYEQLWIPDELKIRSDPR